MKLFSAIAGLALLVAGVSFLRYSIEHGWLAPPVRVAIGILVGVALLVVNELHVARRYRVTANALDAGAIALLFSTFFAAHALWNLIPSLATFLLLALTAAVAVLLSIRRDSRFIAVLGLLGGFATPALLSTGENRPIPLFAYLLLLNVGLAWVAHRRRWAALTALSLALTTLYQWGWVLRFLDAAQVPLAVGIFLIFPLTAFALRALAAGRSADEPEETRLTFERTAAVGAVAPLLFAVLLAAVPAYGARFGVLFGFLFVMDAGLLAIARAQRQWPLHAAGAAATLVVFAVWLGASYVSPAWPWVLGILAVFVLFFLLASPVPARGAAGAGGDPGAVSRAIRLAAPLLLFVLPALVGLEPATARPWIVFGVAFALVAGVAAAAIRRDDGLAYFVGAFFVLAAEAVWCTRYLTLERLGAGIGILSAFGVLYLSVPAVARRVGRPLRPAGGAGVVLLVSLGLLLFLAHGSLAPAALWGLALLLGILNAGLFIESAAGRLPLLSVAGSVVSWLVVGAWWAGTASRAPLLPALTVVGGLALVMIAGHVWTRRRADGADARGMEAGQYVGLGAYVFFAVVAGQPALSIPPWPLFAVLGVVTLAFGTAGLALRKADLHVAAVAATAFTLMIWAGVAGAAPWPAVAIAAAGAGAAYALAWIAVSRAAGDRGWVPPFGAVVAAFLAELEALVAAERAGAPDVALLAAAHLALLAAILAVAGWRRWHHAAVIAVATTALAVLLWIDSSSAAPTWGAILVLATPLYLAFAAYPLVLGRRAGAAGEPYLAAVVAGVPFFFFARHALVLGGFGPMIGALPVAQAALMAVLLRRLLAIEPPGARAQGRLALVAAAALAFITVAIPLQLDREWITLGWALEGAALAWLFRRIPHRGLLGWALALLAIVFVRLAANPHVFHYAPRGPMRILNWYLYTYAIAAAAFFLAGWLLAPTDDRLGRRVPRPAHLLPAAGGILLFLLLNIEIADYYAEGPTIVFRFGAALGQDLSYTIGWLVFALVLLAAGIILRSRPARMASLGLLAVTVSKCFLYDFSRLGGLYRVGSFVGLAVSLALVAIALQKFVLAAPEERT